MAAGEALALCFELNLLDVSSCEDGDANTGGTGGSKNKLFLDMQGLKAKISGLATNLSAEAGGKGADKKNLTDQRELFQRILDFVKVCPYSICLKFKFLVFLLIGILGFVSLIIDGHLFALFAVW